MFSLPSCQLPSQPLPGSQHEQGRGSPALSTRPEADSVFLTGDTLWGLGLRQGWGEMNRRNMGPGRVGVGLDFLWPLPGSSPPASRLPAPPPIPSMDIKQI